MVENIPADYLAGLPDPQRAELERVNAGGMAALREYLAAGDGGRVPGGRGVGAAVSAVGRVNRPAGGRGGGPAGRHRGGDLPGHGRRKPGRGRGDRPPAARGGRLLRGAPGGAEGPDRPRVGPVLDAGAGADLPVRVQGRRDDQLRSRDRGRADAGPACRVRHRLPDLAGRAGRWTSGGPGTSSARSSCRCCMRMASTTSRTASCWPPPSTGARTKGSCRTSCGGWSTAGTWCGSASASPTSGSPRSCARSRTAPAPGSIPGPRPGTSRSCRGIRPRRATTRASWPAARRSASARN